VLENLFGVPFTLASFLVALTVVVFVHEFGHFWVARRNGVRCQAFSIGFGPELFGYTDKLGTRWKFCLIPLGGYVKMFGEAETMQAVEGGREGPAAEGGKQKQIEEKAVPRALTPEEKLVSFKYKTVGQRAAIAVAGPAVNFLFAIAVFWVTFAIVGRPITEPVIGQVEAGSAAAAAGLMTEDRVLSVDGTTIARFEDILGVIQLSTGAPMDVVIKRGAEEMTLKVTPRQTLTKDAFGNEQKAFLLGITPFIEPVIGQVQEDSAAAAAGLMTGDRVLSIDGAAIRRFEDIRGVIQLSTGAPMDMGIKRGAGEMTLKVTPRQTTTKDASGNTTKDASGIEQKVFLLGVSAGEPPYKELNPVSALGEAVTQTYDIVRGTTIAMSQIVAGTRGTEDLGGPIRIAKYSGQAAKTGPAGFIIFMAILSLNLGFINLFPVPLLDGGHLLFYAIEAARGRPLSERAQEWGLRVGLALVLALMVFVSWNDIVHLWPSGGKS
jgi:regulator of sigma E protease